MFYNLVPLLSHNAFISMTIGGRGIGKTFACKELFIRKFLKKGEQFIYLRRREKELGRVKDELFSDLMEENKACGRHIKNEGSRYYISRECIGECPVEDMEYDICGYAFSLNVADDYKSASFPKVQWILFDEFLFEEKRGRKYLKEEVTVFLNFLETIIRNRSGVRVILAANAISLINPYTTFWGIDKKYEQKEGTYYKSADGEVCMELVETSPEFMEMKLQTKLAKVSKGTRFFESSYENKFMLDSICFLRKLPPQSKLSYVGTIRYEKQNYGIWAYKKERSLYVSEQWRKTCSVIYTLLVEDHDEETIFLGFNFRVGILKILMEHYAQGMVYCDSYRSKHILEDIVQHKF